MSFTPDNKNLIASYGGKFYSIPISGEDAINIPFKVKEDYELGPILKFNYPIEDSKSIKSSFDFEKISRLLSDEIIDQIPIHISLFINFCFT